MTILERNFTILCIRILEFYCPITQKRCFSYQYQGSSLLFRVYPDFIHQMTLFNCTNICPQICNAVAVASLLNATLVLPQFLYSNVWKDPRFEFMPCISPACCVKFCFCILLCNCLINFVRIFLSRFILKPAIQRTEFSVHFSFLVYVFALLMKSQWFLLVILTECRIQTLRALHAYVTWISCWMPYTFKQWMWKKNYNWFWSSRITQK